MRSGRSYGQRQSDTLESSFELEDSEAEQVNSAVAIKGEPSAPGRSRSGWGC
ncbi:GM14083 [Drosophila sechellia]|uniref:GM14083 n=1 Tax=Drosophila sechellia TaxID=7238 RepID=B4HTK0_DROSE|nr:GM14083 [Drosophila sechellia]